MTPMEKMVARLGNEPPLLADGRKGPPDKREVSARWLAGTFLTGFTSIILMGVALSAALDGRQVLTTPAEVMATAEISNASGDVSGKSGRLTTTALSLKISDRQVMQVSSIIKEGDRNVVKMIPFGLVTMALGAGHTTKKSYPAFNATDVFADDATKGKSIETGEIYGAKVESEVTLKTVPFPLDNAAYDASNNLTLEEVEEAVRISGTALTEGDVQVASLHYLDPLRFGTGDDFAINASFGVKIVQENVSVAPKVNSDAPATEFAEEIIPLRTDTEPLVALTDDGYDGSDAEAIAEAITTLLSAPKLKGGWALRIGIETIDDRSKIVRASVYDGKTHLFTIAIDDHDQYVPTEAPEISDEILASLGGAPLPPRVRGDLPSVYDGVYRAAYAYDLTPRMAKQLIKMLAASVDYKAQLNPGDTLEVFYSIPEGLTKPGDDSDVLFVDANFSGSEHKFYRFKNDDGSADYYDENGGSSQQFLLRVPVPGARMTSGFGMRRHPILGYMKLHAGTDWAGPIGTPILSTGNGVVERAGWTSGYGYQTLIKHANGYETSYSHQSRISPEVFEGAQVRQGQLIGAIGNTGLSTGPHLHYEMIINGTKVDAMAVRLPSGKGLSGSDLVSFKKERDRIDALLESESEPQKVATN